MEEDISLAGDGEGRGGHIRRSAFGVEMNRPRGGAAFVCCARVSNRKALPKNKGLIGI